MKAKRTKVPHGNEPAVLNDAAAGSATASAPVLRTQIYLSKAECDFLQKETLHRDLPMAAVIRSFIDERMEVPQPAWADNPLLQPAVEDPSWEGREDGAVNHDHYIYGTPKRWMKKNGKCVETPPLPDDYYTNPASRRAFDEMVNERS